jgi:hypothetical protein
MYMLSIFIYILSFGFHKRPITQVVLLSPFTKEATKILKD